MSGYTTEYIEREIGGRVRRDGGFSTFWVEDNYRRAGVVTDMFTEGKLVREDGQYPWVKCKVNEAALKGKP